MKQTLFRSFRTREERLASGGTAYVEFQFCRLPVGTPARELVSVENIDHWADDSLYVHVDDWDAFWPAYGPVLDGGLHEDMTTGPLDAWGINYYAPAMAEQILTRLCELCPPEHGTLTAWLSRARECNGFYVLGV